MPADVPYAVTIGAGGLNLRDQPVTVPPSELVDSLNWELDEHGALVKRLGYITYPDSNQLAGIPLEVTTYNPSVGQAAMLFYCDDGHVYSSPGDGTFTSIASGLSTSARPSFVQMNDVMYWSNGSDALKSWDGTTLTSIAAAPHGKYLAVWQNSLCISGDASNPHRFYWSAIADPATWPSFNFVDLFGPRGDVVTGLTTAQNLGISSDGSDGVLVFERRAMHRVIDITQNVAGAVIGGANVLVDSSTGTVSHRSIANVNGRVYCVGVDGIYSTDGHRQLNLESGKITRLFQNGLSSTLTKNLTAISYQNRYRLAATRSGDTQNSLVVDLYTQLPRDKGGDADYPIMVQQLPVSAWTVYPGATGDTIYFVDASLTPSDDRKYVRQLNFGGTDTDASATDVTIVATARTGSSFFGTEGPKRVRRIVIEGRGRLTVGVSSDLSQGTGESQSFDLNIESPKWGPPLTWGNFRYGAAGFSKLAQRWYTLRGRLFNFTLTDNTTDVGTTRSTLGVPSATSGGAAVYSVVAWMIPLDADN